MSRQIKFRVWDPTEDGMVADSTYWITPGGAVYEDCGHNGFMQVKDRVVMQFTGIHDADGKEIYEGDVVVLRNSDRSKYKYSVVWDHERAGFIAYRPIADLSQSYQLGGMFVRVIGNVYENPNLVKDNG